jgi:hypothetical protein
VALAHRGLSLDQPGDHQPDAERQQHGKEWALVDLALQGGDPSRPRRLALVASSHTSPARPVARSTALRAHRPRVLISSVAASSSRRRSAVAMASPLGSRVGSDPIITETVTGLIQVSGARSRAVATGPGWAAHRNCGKFRAAATARPQGSARRPSRLLSRACRTRRLSRRDASPRLGARCSTAA